MQRALSAFILLLVLAPAVAAQPGNLLRNGDFQDDWLTLLPENKNHHWCYSSEFYNRRDYNPDGWFCKGSWQWLDADKPRGRRRLVLQGPSAQLTQRVNWVLVHDSKAMGNMADAGGFPSIKPQRSLVPERLVRDLTLRVRLKGQDVPAKAGTVELGLCPPGALSMSDPLGTMVPPTTTVTVPIPEGSYDFRWVDVKLSALQWLEAVKQEAAKKPKEAAELAKAGPLLPGTVRVALHYQGKTGSVELERAELLEAGPSSPNLLPNGGLESAGKHPHQWLLAEKYRYFPGRLYYLFNTWHNGNSANRGKVQSDFLVLHGGTGSLQMIVPPGDEVAVSSQPFFLRQKEPRLIEVHAWVKTDRLAMLNLDAITDSGERLDGFPFIHMAPHSIGTDSWRLIRQVFRPREPINSMRLLLCARGVNGYTLDDTDLQPWNNVVGTIWWDDVSVYEPESTKEELVARDARPVVSQAVKQGPHIAEIDLGERMLGQRNRMTATVVNPGPPAAFDLWWKYERRSGVLLYAAGKTRQQIPTDGRADLEVPYDHSEGIKGTLTLTDAKRNPIQSNELWVDNWERYLNLRLGALYLRPEQKQLVRINLGVAWEELQRIKSIRLEVVRRGTAKVVLTKEVPVTPAIITAQRTKLPKDLRDDLTNLVLADLDVSGLPIQPFHDPQRNWIVRATVVGLDEERNTVESSPFCRLAHAPPQPPVQSVHIKNNLLYVNSQPWMPWGVVYGHVPVYDGPADPGPGKYLDLHNLPAWSMYDRFTAATYTRKENDFNCRRYVAGSITDKVKDLEKIWQDNQYASSAFVVPQPAFSVEELFKQAGGKDKLLANLAYLKTAPMVVSTAPGIEEAFGLFTGASAEQLKGLSQVVDFVRKETGKPVMVSHGGYWNRLEFEKVPFFDIFDPETEPLYPANLHTDLWPLVKGKDKVIWLRPQMYEDVPYERWRYHVFVELMRGCRGWQIAHGPGDTSLFRGLHGELEFFKPIVYSPDAGPAVHLEPWIEHWSRRHKGKTYIIAATTRGLTLGKWNWEPVDYRPGDAPTRDEQGARRRVTGGRHHYLGEANSYGADQKVDEGPSIHGIQYLPDARSWPKGSKLVQWVRLPSGSMPKNLVFLVKTEGRWTHAASWGKFDAASWTKDPKQALWFLRSFYRHSYGFLGWDQKLLDKALPFIPSKVASMGNLPKPHDWVRLELPLDQVGATDGLLDGIGFAHEGGQVGWGRTLLVDPAGESKVVWGDSVELPPSELAKTKIHVAGLKAGTRIRVLFEDRELAAGAGHFIDDFRGQDLYQRYGGGYGVGYGNGTVALHLYEIEGP